MASIVESNTLVEIHKPDGSVERVFPITKAENIIGSEKLTAIQTKALKLLAVNSYIVDDTTGETYKIGMDDGGLYFEKSDVSIKELLDTITDVIKPEDPDPETPPSDPVDKSNLTSTIANATANFNNSSNLATTEMRTTFSAEINSAQIIADNAEATQDDVNNAVTSLENANTAFMNESLAIVTARNNLSSTLSTANSAAENTDTYTPGSISLLQTVITASETIYNSTEIYVAQTYIDQKNNLLTAISNLSKKANKTNLSDGIQSAITDITNSSETWIVTEATLNAFNTALTNAQTVADNPNAVQSDADNALETLNTTKSAFVAEHAAISSARTSLNTAITQASEEVVKTDMYTSASVTTLREVLTDASELYNDETIHVAQNYIDKKSELQNAINSLVIKINNSNLVSLIATANSNLNDNTKLATVDMKTILTNAISAAQTVADNELATKTEIDNTITTLQQANTTYITGSEEIVTAKNDLNTVISSANTEVAKTNTYHSSSITTLQSKLTEAQTLYDDSVVHVASDYSTKKNELQESINGMVNISQLVAKINEVENDSRITEYLNAEDSGTSLHIHNCIYYLDKAKESVSEEEPTVQHIIDGRLSDLTESYEACVQECTEITNIRNNLTSLIASANTYLNDNRDQYTPSSISALWSAQDLAQHDLENDLESHFCQRIPWEEDLNRLQTAINGLTLRADFTQLNTTITSAQAVASNTSYIATPEMKTTLANAITSAQTVNNNKDSTQTEVDNAKTALQTACNEYVTQSDVIVSARNDLNTMLTAANGELSKTNTYTVTSYNILQTKVTEAQTLYNDTTIHPASDYTSKKSEVQTAIDGLYNIVLLKAGIDAAKKTLDRNFNDGLLGADKYPPDDTFYNIFKKNKADCRELITKLNNAYQNANVIYYNYNKNYGG